MMKTFAQSHLVLRPIAGVAVALALLSSPALAQDTGASDLEPFYFTNGQAVGGKSNYQRLCAECHGNDLEGSGAPALSGATFSGRIDAPLIDLFDFVQQQMPAGAGGTMTNAQTATIIAYIGKFNGMTEGDKAMPIEPEEMGDIRFGQ